MREGLPDGHGLSDQVIANERLLPKVGDTVLLTNVQYTALEYGVARGTSLLIVSPTSTGKTNIGMWAIAAALERGCRTAYLVTHRALAKQKFSDLRSIFLRHQLRNLGEDIVLATGDEIVDGDGQPPSAPLDASIVVATYEKYLGLLSSGGLPSDLSRLVVVCDEIQLVSDANRGPAVEILLTLLIRARCQQLIGLSAVLNHSGAETLASWLGCRLLYDTRREKRLVYECRTPVATFVANTDHDHIDEFSPRALNTLDILDELRRVKSRLPIIVFCMTKSQTYDLASQFETRVQRPRTLKHLIAALFGSEPETNAETLLAKYLPLRFAVHNADMTDEERALVERGLAEGTLDIVFATSTLAAGVNFPLATAVFHSWARWDRASRTSVPIEPSEFHNMAGRVGRMGFADQDGLVIFTAERNYEINAARQYMDFSHLSELRPRIDSDQFEVLALHLISAGLGQSQKDLLELISSTLSGSRELATNRFGLRSWEVKLREAIERLCECGFLRTK